MLTDYIVVKRFGETNWGYTDMSDNGEPLRHSEGYTEKQTAIDTARAHATQLGLRPDADVRIIEWEAGEDPQV